MIYIEVLLLVGITLNLGAWLHTRLRTEIRIDLEEGILLFIMLVLPYLFIGLYLTLSKSSIRIHTTQRRPKVTKATKNRKKRN